MDFVSRLISASSLWIIEILQGVFKLWQCKNSSAHSLIKIHQRTVLYQWYWLCLVFVGWEGWRLYARPNAQSRLELAISRQSWHVDLVPHVAHNDTLYAGWIWTGALSTAWISLHFLVIFLFTKALFPLTLKKILKQTLPEFFYMLKCSLSVLILLFGKFLFCMLNFGAFVQRNEPLAWSSNLSWRAVFRI